MAKAKDDVFSSGTAKPSMNKPQLLQDHSAEPSKNKGSCSGYSFVYSLDPYVVLSTVGGRATGYGYWVQPTGNGSTGFLQPVRMAC